VPGRIRPVRNAALHAPNIIVLIEEIDGTVSKHEYLYREIVVFSGWIFFDGVVWPFIDGGLVAIRKESDLYLFGSGYAGLGLRCGHVPRLPWSSRGN
jgi:hypothetical protein